MMNVKRIRYPKKDINQDRDNFVLAKLLTGESLGITPLGIDKWYLSAQRLLWLGWSIHKIDTTEASTFWGLDEADIKQAGLEGQEFASKYYLSKLIQ